jgi:hypothetical protein
MEGDLTIYHWKTLTSLARLSPSVYIASLTLPRDVMNNNPTFRNLRMVIVPLLFVWLLVALWPMRHEPGRGHSIFPDTPATAAGPVAIDLPATINLPANYFWSSSFMHSAGFYKNVDLG